MRETAHSYSRDPKVRKVREGEKVDACACAAAVLKKRTLRKEEKAKSEKGFIFNFLKCQK